MNASSKHLAALLPAAFLGLVLLAPARASAAPPEFSAAQLTRIGGQYVQEGKDDKALKVLGDALKKEPGQAEAHYLLGMVHARAGEKDPARLKQAGEHLEQSLALDPSRYEAWMLLGMVKDLGADHAGAADVFRKAAARFPDRPQAFQELGASLMLLGKPAEAVKALESAAKNALEDDEVLADLAYARILARQCEGALEAIGKAEKLNRRSATLPGLRGDAHACLGQTGPAIEAFEVAVKRNPANVRAWFHLGLMRSKTDEKDAARQAFLKTLELEPGHAKAREALERLGK